MTPEWIPYINRFKQSIVALENFRDEVLLVEFDRRQVYTDDALSSMSPSRREAFTLLGIMRGGLDISIDYHTHHIPANGIVWILPTHITQMISSEPNTRVWMLLIAKSFIDASFDMPKDPSAIVSYMNFKRHPFIVYEPDDFAFLYANLQNVKRKMQMFKHLFHREMISVSIKEFLLEMGNLSLTRKDYHHEAPLSRQEEIFAGFLTLLNEHCKTEHAVSFYAEKLCITPQYLSLILRQQSNHSASRWIQDTLIVEAKNLLRTPRITVQEVADRLCFPDQSSFGKFFKKHVGISPVAFRKES